MVIDSDSPPANPIADFEDFLKTYEETPNEFKYRKRISEAYSRGENFILVLFEDILNYNPSLANYLKNHPQQALEEAKEAFKNILRIDSGGLFNPDEEYFVRIYTQNNSGEVKLRQIRAKHVDKLIYVRGIVIRAARVNPEVTLAAFECPLCGNVMQLPQTPGRLQQPKDCSNPNCQNKKDFKIRTEDSEFIDYQRITIQEAPEELRSGSIPQTLSVILLYDLVDAVRPGERVKVMGILHSVPVEDNRGKITTIFKTELFANSIEGMAQEEDIDLTVQDIEEIRSLAREPQIQKKIARSVARTIMGQDHLKMAAALSLFSGNEKHKKDGSRIRGDIHVLFLGDPGTGKSQILQSCALIAARAIYTSGKGASAAGLTAAVVRENDMSGLQLEAGALVLASGGTACIDEFDKMKETDRVAIHEAMEQQTVSIAKAGIVATLQSKTSIIAAANPKSGRYDDYKTPADNINLSPPILSRFDLIFIVRDKPNQHEDDRIADFVLSSHMEGYDDTYMEEDKTKKSSTSLEDQYIQLDLLKKYVRYARNTCHPQLTRETAARIKAFYVKMRNSQPGESAAIAIVARTLEGIIRMCEAYAKMAIRDFVLIEDVDDVIELVNRSLKEVGFDQETGAIDVDRVLTGNPKSKKDKIRKILDKIQELQEQIPKAPVTLDDIFTPLASGGITRSFLEEALEELTKEATIYQPKPGEYRVARKIQANPKKTIEQTEPKNELSEKNEKGGN